MKRMISIIITLIMLLSIIPTISCFAMGDYSGNITGATWYWPIHGFSSATSAYSMITSSYGYRGSGFKSNHYGVDIGASMGTTIYPVRDGTVCLVKNDLSYGQGRTVFINHNDGYYSVYMHLSSIYVSAGQTVDINTPIAASGASGYDSETYYGPHLHLGIHYGSSYSYNCNVNPCPPGYTRVGSAMQESEGGRPEGVASISYSVNGVIAPLPVPESPTITSVSAISTSSLKVKWTAVDNANSYEVYRRKSGESWSDAVLVATSKSTSYTDEGLDAGTKYYYRVVAVNGSFKSEQSESNSSYTKPKVITAVNFSDITTDSVTLEWNAVKSAVSYDIYKRKSGESWSGSEPIANTVSTYFVDTDLEAGEKYYYRIITVNESTESEMSESFSVYARLNTPIIKSASKIAPTSLEISWDKVDKATSYEVYRREAGDSWSGIEPIANVATTYFNDSELKAGTRYYYRIVALNGATSSVQSESFRVYTAYNISYNTNDGTDPFLFQSKIYDESISLSDIIPSRDGYYFKEWNTEADGSGISYNPGDMYTENKNIVLYAQWEKQIPSIKSTVTKINLEYIIETKIENISSTSYEIIIAGYKDGKIIGMEKVSYNEQNLPHTIKGDIDEIKVMVWDSLSSMKPLCEAEVIPSSEFIVE